MVTICCVCNKTKTDYGWQDKNISNDELHSHGYCPKCAEKALEEIRLHRRETVLTSM